MADRTLFDIVNAKEIASYYNTLASNAVPYMGPALFPPNRNTGLNLSWIEGYDSLPVVLMPAAFDARPVLRDRGYIAKKEYQMPFFREAMRIGEKDRQNLLTLMQMGDRYIEDAIQNVFNDAATLIAGAQVNPEIMRFSLLQTGAINISTPVDAGINVNYQYNYDTTGQWSRKNVVVLAGAQQWGQTDANPIRDIMAIKRQAKQNGTTLTRAIVSPKVWAQLLQNASILLQMAPFPVGTATNPQNAFTMSDSDLSTFLQRKTGIAFVQYDKYYKGLDGEAHSYMMDDRVIFLPDGTLGETFYGRTPEEVDVMGKAGNDAQVQIVDTGVAVLSKLEVGPPVNVITSVDEIVLPTFPRMKDVWVLEIGEEAAA
jgi:hypothetical protein